MARPLVPFVRGGAVTVVAEQTERRARDLCAALVGRRTGIVREISEAETIDGDAPLFHFGARIANAHPHLEDHPGLSVGGCGPTRDGALIAALCEGFERYAASSYDRRARGIPRSRTSLGAAALALRSLAVFSDEQRARPGFPYAPVDEDTPLQWVEGRSLADGSDRFVPAFAVYTPYEPADGEPLVAPGLSTGLACGESIEQAVLEGLCEVIERDALALTWMRGVSPPRIDSDLVGRVSGPLLPPADHVHAYDLTTDTRVPVCLVVCTGRGPRGSMVSVGSACNLDPLEALRKAAREASQDRVYVRLLIDTDPSWQPEPDFSNVTDFPLHARLYSGRPELARRALRFLGQNEQGSTVFKDVRDPFRTENHPSAIIDSVARSGIGGAWVDLTQPWAEPLGLHVIKVVTGELLPLHGHHGLPFAAHPRLEDWRSALPAGAVRHDFGVWPYPHPFP